MRLPGTLPAESVRLAHNNTEEALGAWLDTIAADTTRSPASLTVRPQAGSRQPLLQEFSKLSSTSSAAPLEVKGTLAEGGMGLIRLAEQEALGRTVVVKTLRENYAPEAAEHVLREAWATGALEHPNIVPVHDIRVDDDGAPLIVLKRIEGLSWTDSMFDAEAVQTRFAASNLLEWNLGILKQVILAIRFAHSRGVLHRDLKPDNVMIGSFGEVYVVDWGIALSLPNATDSRLPPAKDADSIAGTPCYMAPEMLGDGPLDERTDTYLLGAVLYEILASEPPHKAKTLRELMDEIRHADPVLPPDACPLLGSLCQRAMHRDPEGRFQDAGAFGLALQVCLEQRESMRLAEVAQIQRDRLEQTLQEPDVSRHECYRFFGALRLAYIEALRVWPGNEAAQRELDTARIDIINYELGQGNPHAAQSIFTELSTPPPGLEASIEKAKRKQQDELAELGQFRDDSNLAVGSRTRIFLISILGLLWTTTPLLKYLWEFSTLMTSYTGMSLVTGSFMIVTTGLWYWARDTLTSTQVNRRLSASLATLFPIQFILFAGGALMGMSVTTSQQLMIFVWTTIAAGVSVTVDLRFWPVAVGYALAFLAAAQWPEARFFAMSAGNGLLTLTAVYIWYPRGDVYPGGLLKSRKKAAYEQS